ncbi:MAG: peptidoglycan-associated lipoprotein Pal [Dyella sp.]|nr:peptidoglycan-associated lipoprotein Pal [Dyella sp.]
MMYKSLASLSIVGLLAACASTPKPIENATTPDTKPVVQNTTTTQPVAPTQQTKLDPLNDPSSVLAKRSVYFDFDKYEVRADQRDVVDAHGRYLSGNQAASVRVEGNADERGSREYNLALGQKRAEAVRKAMVQLGANDKQIEAISNGKEKPKATGHDEASWTENRRDDLVYTAH